MAMKFRPKYAENGNSIRYTVLQSDKYSDESDNEISIPLQSKKEVATLDVEIDFDDTLQAIALKYHCTIAELKRINNIIRENEIYARRTIRVPVRPHSILSELIVGVHVSGNCSPITSQLTQEISVEQKSSSSDVDQSAAISLLDINTEQLEKKLLSNASLHNETSDLNSLIYNSRIANSYENSNANGSNDALECNNDNVILQQSINRNIPLVHKLLSSGDDCGLSWLALVILVLILGFICPLIYILYIAEHPEKFHHHH